MFFKLGLIYNYSIFLLVRVKAHSMILCSRPFNFLNECPARRTLTAGRTYEVLPEGRIMNNFCPSAWTSVNA